MKVLQVCSYYVGFNKGQSLYKNLFDGISKEIDNKVLYFTNKGNETSFLPSNFIISKSYNKFERYIFKLKHNKVYNDIKNKIDLDTDLTHAHSLFSNGYISYRLKKEYGIRYIVAVRNTDIFVFFKYMLFLRKLGIDILKEAEKVIFLSKSYRDILIEKYIPYEFKKEFLEKTIIIPNSIDPYYTDNLYTQKKLIKDSLKLIYIGRIDDPNKNIKKTIEAIDYLIEKGEKIELKLIGRLKDKRYKKFIEKRKYIKTLPFSSKEVLLKELRKSNIFIMPSITETFGLVYAEAMSQGLPVIYTKGQGFYGQFIEGDIGYGVNHLDKKDIAEKIMMIKKDYDNISKRTIQRVSKFYFKRILDNYIKLYIEVNNESINGIRGVSN